MADVPLQTPSKQAVRGRPFVTGRSGNPVRAARLRKEEKAEAAAPLVHLSPQCLARRSIALQQSLSENLLLICCKTPHGSRGAKRSDGDLLSKTMELELHDRSDTTGAREICC
jgi:hypothetical protein